MFMIHKDSLRKYLKKIIDIESYNIWYSMRVLYHTVNVLPIKHSEWHYHVSYIVLRVLAPQSSIPNGTHNLTLQFLLC